MSGAELREIRKAIGLTQKALGARLGVTVKTVSFWELGKSGKSEVPPMAALAIKQLRTEHAQKLRGLG